MPCSCTALSRGACHPSPEFGGATYSEPRDRGRLRAQLDAVRDAMSRNVHVPPHSSRWWTLAELEAYTGYPQASISARLRDLRKPRHGLHTVTKEYVANGVWRYRLTLRVPEPVVAPSQWDDPMDEARL